MKKFSLFLAGMAIVGTSFAQNYATRKYPSTALAGLVSMDVASAKRQSTELKKAISPIGFTKNSQRGAAATTDTITNHFTGPAALYTATSGGFVNGHNGYGDVSKMQKFDGSYGVTSTGTITKVLLMFGAKTGNPASTINVNIWDDAAGEPGSIIGTVSVPFSDIDTTSANGITVATFATPINIPANKIFYAGFTVTYAGSDAVGLLSTQDLAFPDAATHTWEEWGTGEMMAIGDPTNWDLQIALAVFPVVELDAVVPPAGEAGVFHSENFDAGMPANYTLYNVDGRTPATGVAQVTNAWVSYKYTANPTPAAISTSWYTPAGQADDWMVTPGIAIPDTATSVFLSWKGKAMDPAFPDGYEVRLSTVSNQIADLTNVLYTTQGENPAFTERKVDISAYIGETVYIAFRNNSSDAFVLAIDDIKVYEPSAFDIKTASATVSGISALAQYNKIPANQLPSGSYPVSVTIENLGASTPAAVTVIANILNKGVSVYSDTVVVTNVPASGTTLAVPMTKEFSLSNAVGENKLLLQSKVMIAEADGNSQNDTLTTVVGSIAVTDTVYARDNNVASSTISIGGNGTNKHLGVMYDIHTTQTLSAITIGLSQPKVNRKLSVSVYTFNGTPSNNPIAISNQYTLPTAGLFNVPISEGVELTPGQYLVTVDEFDSSALVAGSLNVYTPQTVWVRGSTIAGGAWNPVDNFSATFHRALFIRPVFGTVVTVGMNNSKALDAAINVYPNPSTGIVNLSIEGTDLKSYEVTITDLLGKVVTKINNVPTGVNNLDLSSVSNGIYMIRVQSGDAVSTQKLIINR